MTKRKPCPHAYLTRTGDEPYVCDKCKAEFTAEEFYAMCDDERTRDVAKVLVSPPSG